MAFRDISEIDGHSRGMMSDFDYNYDDAVDCVPHEAATRDPFWVGRIPNRLLIRILSLEYRSSGEKRAVMFNKTYRKNVKNIRFEIEGKAYNHEKSDYSVE